ncbi:hypothetical protein BAE44_0001935 [Dichanthelium oligosanthes]|uniref:Uncharacterized protein n=1 Tax=Dichanthelium oligosanthes TaxID=888268 RepID=A0A1E5WI21_9POAL|nr:hypothetical protein BAE44_0001935 [Dichanthelium oligosanthes]
MWIIDSEWEPRTYGILEKLMKRKVIAEEDAKT